MAFKFNPFTGNLDITSSGGTDHHCGWATIQVGQTVTIVLYKQMVVFGDFINDGTLLVDGDLILED